MAADDDLAVWLEGQRPHEWEVIGASAEIGQELAARAERGVEGPGRGEARNDDLAHAGLTDDDDLAVGLERERIDARAGREALPERVDELAPGAERRIEVPRRESARKRDEDCGQDPERHSGQPIPPHGEALGGTYRHPAHRPTLVRPCVSRNAPASAGYAE